MIRLRLPFDYAQGKRSAADVNGEYVLTLTFNPKILQIRLILVRTMCKRITKIKKITSTYNKEEIK